MPPVAITGIPIPAAVNMEPDCLDPRFHEACPRLDRGNDEEWRPAFFPSFPQKREPTSH